MAVRTGVRPDCSRARGRGGRAGALAPAGAPTETVAEVAPMTVPRRVAELAQLVNALDAESQGLQHGLATVAEAVRAVRPALEAEAALRAEAEAHFMARLEALRSEAAANTEALRADVAALSAECCARFSAAAWVSQGSAQEQEAVAHDSGAADHGKSKQILVERTLHRVIGNECKQENLRSFPSHADLHAIADAVQARVRQDVQDVVDSGTNECLLRLEAMLEGLHESEQAALTQMARAQVEVVDAAVSCVTVEFRDDFVAELRNQATAQETLAAEIYKCEEACLQRHSVAESALGSVRHDVGRRDPHSRLDSSETILAERTRLIACEEDLAASVRACEEECLLRYVELNDALQDSRHHADVAVSRARLDCSEAIVAEQTRFTAREEDLAASVRTCEESCLSHHAEAWRNSEYNTGVSISRVRLDISGLIVAEQSRLVKFEDEVVGRLRSCEVACVSRHAELDTALHGLIHNANVDISRVRLDVGELIVVEKARNEAREEELAAKLHACETYCHHGMRAREDVERELMVEQARHTAAEEDIVASISRLEQAFHAKQGDLNDDLLPKSASASRDLENIPRDFGGKVHGLPTGADFIQAREDFKVEMDSVNWQCSVALEGLVACVHQCEQDCSSRSAELRDEVAVAVLSARSELAEEIEMERCRRQGCGEEFETIVIRHEHTCEEIQEIRSELRAALLKCETGALPGVSEAHCKFMEELTAETLRCAAGRSESEGYFVDNAALCERIADEVLLRMRIDFGKEMDNQRHLRRRCTEVLEELSCSLNGCDPRSVPRCVEHAPALVLVRTGEQGQPSDDRDLVYAAQSGDILDRSLLMPPTLSRSGLPPPTELLVSPSGRLSGVLPAVVLSGVPLLRSWKKTVARVLDAWQRRARAGGTRRAVMDACMQLHARALAVRTLKAFTEHWRTARAASDRSAVASQTWAADRTASRLRDSLNKWHCRAARSSLYRQCDNAIQQWAFGRTVNRVRDAVGKWRRSAARERLLQRGACALGQWLRTSRTRYLLEAWRALVYLDRGPCSWPDTELGTSGQAQAISSVSVPVASCPRTHDMCSGRLPGTALRSLDHAPPASLVDTYIASDRGKQGQRPCVLDGAAFRTSGQAPPASSSGALPAASDPRTPPSSAKQNSVSRASSPLCLEHPVLGASGPSTPSSLAEPGNFPSLSIVPGFGASGSSSPMTHSSSNSSL